MSKNILITLITLLTLSNLYLFFRFEELERRSEGSEALIGALSADTKVQGEQIKETATQLTALKLAPSTTTARPTPATGVPVSPKMLASELALAQSYKLDGVVDWIGLIEDKLYFILFPLPEGPDRDRQAAELRERGDQIRSQFATVAQHELTLRSQLQQKLQERNLSLPDENREQ